MVNLKSLAPNFTQVQLGKILLFFSYQTIVAFQDARGDYYKTSTKYSKITSKHLNSLPPTTIMLAHDDFQKQLEYSLQEVFAR